MALTWEDDLRQGEAMRGIARTVVLAATCDIADAPVDPVRSKLAGSVGSAPHGAPMPTRSPVLLGSGESSR